MNPWPVEARDPRGPPPAPGPRRPRRHVEVPARPTCATSSSARARARPPRAWPAARWPRRSCARSASRSSRTSCRSGRSRADAARRPRRSTHFAGVDDDPVRCLDPEATRGDGRAHQRAAQGATSRSAASSRSARSASCPASGSHVSWEERLDGRLAMALASIQAVKGVGLGEGFDLAGKPGSEAHDEIFYDDERGFYRETNHSGGLEGGMTTGEPLVVPRRAQADPDADQAAALGRHRDARAGAGAARAHRLVRRAGRRRRRRGDGRVRAGRARTARSSAATTSTTCARPSSGTRSASAGGARAAAA